MLLRNVRVCRLLRGLLSRQWLLRSIRVRRLLRGLLPLLLLLRADLRSLCGLLRWRRRELGRRIPRLLLLPLMLIRSRRVRDSAPRTRSRVLLRGR